LPSGPEAALGPGKLRGFRAAGAVRRAAGSITLERENGETATVKQVPERVEKPWGYELIWARTEEYVGKILHVAAGESLSLQYHEVKDETIFLFTGEMRFWAGPSAEELAEVDLGPGEAFRVAPGTVHRMQAVTDCDILEVSTPHLDDVVRIQDRYGRAPEG
jgi:mannose-6-phosphate isomerase